MPAGNGVKISWFGWAAAAIVPALISFLLVPFMFAAIMLGLW
ncbi:anion permease [uncultured Lactobacillus sp.]|nr:anion permease [uncultured Lactobacillus sp.]